MDMEKTYHSTRASTHSCDSCSGGFMGSPHFTAVAPLSTGAAEVAGFVLGFACAAFISMSWRNAPAE
jgi:hypothetical protein